MSLFAVPAHHVEASLDQFTLARARRGLGVVILFIAVDGVVFPLAILLILVMGVGGGSGTLDALRAVGLYDTGLRHSRDTSRGG